MFASCKTNLGQYKKNKLGAGGGQSPHAECAFPAWEGCPLGRLVLCLSVCACFCPQFPAEKPVFFEPGISLVSVVRGPRRALWKRRKRRCNAPLCFPTSVLRFRLQRVALPSEGRKHRFRHTELKTTPMERIPGARVAPLRWAGSTVQTAGRGTAFDRVWSGRSRGVGQGRGRKAPSYRPPLLGGRPSCSLADHHYWRSGIHFYLGKASN
eukprot:gene23209-biopygen5810